MSYSMNVNVTIDSDVLSMDEATLRQIGVDELAYARPMRGGDLRRAFPKLNELDEDAHMWALFSAEGLPLALAESRGRLQEMAQQSDLDFVQLH
ncbi:MAG: DUF1150 family protein [Pseudomonadota bacterium]